jgi:hypothetical protein
MKNPTISEPGIEITGFKCIICGQNYKQENQAILCNNRGITDRTGLKPGLVLSFKPYGGISKILVLSQIKQSHADIFYWGMFLGNIFAEQGVHPKSDFEYRGYLHVGCKGHYQCLETPDKLRLAFIRNHLKVLSEKEYDEFMDENKKWWKFDNRAISFLYKDHNPPGWSEYYRTSPELEELIKESEELKKEIINLSNT